MMHAEALGLGGLHRYPPAWSLKVLTAANSSARMSQDSVCQIFCHSDFLTSKRNKVFRRNFDEDRLVQIIDINYI